MSSRRMRMITVGVWVVFSVLLIAWASRAHAQSGLRMVPAGFCSLSGMSTSTGFSGNCTYIGGANLNTITYAVICTYVQGVTWRDDGTPPTATAGAGGQGLAAGQCMPYNANFNAVRFIQQTSGAILGATFYK